MDPDPRGPKTCGSGSGFRNTGSKFVKAIPNYFPQTFPSANVGSIVAYLDSYPDTDGSIPVVPYSLRYWTSNRNIDP